MAKKILIVDDNAVNRARATAVLKKSGFIVQDVEDGFKALNLLEIGGFDNVLLDINMPGINGEEVCKKIRSNPKMRGLRVVAYTAHVQEADKRKLIEIGFDDVITKPATRQMIEYKM